MCYLKEYVCNKGTVLLLVLQMFAFVFYLKECKMPLL